mmetsp:Transcript_98600/g.277257  ORF Transcript_98600/g.277257 Transcript_98600/m.277257 type:complete len:212 (-) Transcript_98600:93-728(-)
MMWPCQHSGRETVCRKLRLTACRPPASDSSETTKLKIRFHMISPDQLSFAVSGATSSGCRKAFDTELAKISSQHANATGSPAASAMLSCKTDLSCAANEVRWGRLRFASARPTASTSASGPLRPAKANSSARACSCKASAAAADVAALAAEAVSASARGRGLRDAGGGAVSDGSEGASGEDISGQMASFAGAAVPPPPPPSPPRPAWKQFQ